MSNTSLGPKDVPNLPVAELTVSGNFVRIGSSDAFELVPDVKVRGNDPIETPLANCGVQRIEIEASYYWVTYPKVICHGLPDDILNDVTSIETGKIARSKNGSIESVSGDFYLDKGSLPESRFSLFCSVKSGPWLGILKSQRDFCSGCSVIESHSFEILSFPGIYASWGGPIEAMPPIQGLSIIWGTKMGPQSSQFSCGGTDVPMGPIF